MNMLVNGNVASRMLSVREWVKTLGFNESDIMSTMISVADTLTTGKTSHVLHLGSNYENGNTIKDDGTLNLISQNDAFAPVGIRQLVRKRVSTNYAIADVVNYPDRTLFDFAGEADQIKGVFNGGKAALLVETTTVIETIMAQQLSSPVGLQSAAAQVASLGSPGEYESFVNLHKDVLLSGQADAKISFNLFGFSPAAAIIGDSAVSGEQNDVVFQLVGFVIKGGGNKAAQMANNQQGEAKCVIRGL